MHKWINSRGIFFVWPTDQRIFWSLYGNAWTYLKETKIERNWDILVFFCVRNHDPSSFNLWRDVWKLEYNLWRWEEAYLWLSPGTKSSPGTDKSYFAVSCEGGGLGDLDISCMSWINWYLLFGEDKAGYTETLIACGWIVWPGIFAKAVKQKPR